MGPFKYYVILLVGGGRSPKEYIRLQGGVWGVHQKTTLDNYKGGGGVKLVEQKLRSTQKCGEPKK